MILPVASCLLFIVSISKDSHSSNSTCTPLWPTPLPHLKNIIIKFSSNVVTPQKGSMFHPSQKPLTILRIINLKFNITPTPPKPLHVAKTPLHPNHSLPESTLFIPGNCTRNRKQQLGWITKLSAPIFLYKLFLYYLCLLPIKTGLIM